MSSRVVELEDEPTTPRPPDRLERLERRVRRLEVITIGVAAEVAAVLLKLFF